MTTWLRQLSFSKVPLPLVAFFLSMAPYLLLAPTLLLIWQSPGMQSASDIDQRTVTEAFLWVSTVVSGLFAYMGKVKTRRDDALATLMALVPILIISNLNTVGPFATLVLGVVALHLTVQWYFTLKEIREEHTHPVVPV